MDPNLLSVPLEVQITLISEQSCMWYTKWVAVWQRSLEQVFCFFGVRITPVPNPYRFWWVLDKNHSSIQLGAKKKPVHHYSLFKPVAIHHSQLYANQGTLHIKWHTQQVQAQMNHMDSLRTAGALQHREVISTVQVPVGYL